MQILIVSWTKKDIPHPGILQCYEQRFYEIFSRYTHHT